MQNSRYAREQFRQRKIASLLAVMLIPISLVMLSPDAGYSAASMAFAVFVECGVAACVAYLIYTAMRMPVPCRSCGKYVMSDEDYICGKCDSVNKGSLFWHSFLGSCRRCEDDQKSLRCPRCGTVFALDRDEELGHPARLVSDTTVWPQPSPTVPIAIEPEPAKVPVPDPAEEYLKDLVTGITRAIEAQASVEDTVDQLLHKYELQWRDRGVAEIEILNRLRKMKGAALEVVQEKRRKV